MLDEVCRGKPMVICSDSHAALEALDGYLVRLRDVLRCRELLGNYRWLTSTSVRLLWVPGLSGVVGNENSDRLPNRGTKGVESLTAASADLNATCKSF